MSGRIYTRTGDDGTATVGGRRASKVEPVFEVLGAFDELDAWLGMLPETPLLARVQDALFALMGDLAGYTPFATKLVPELEAEINRLNPTGAFSFVSPRGPIHVARTVCRRAERELVRFNPRHPALPFVNRLSDYLFTLAEKTSVTSHRDFF